MHISLLVYYSQTEAHFSPFNVMVPLGCNPAVLSPALQLAAFHSWELPGNA